MWDQYLGVIQMVAYTFAPANFSFCSGQLVAVAQNNALFALLGDYYGGDARTVFGLPDFRARTPVGSDKMGRAPGLESLRLGARYGLQTHTLTPASLPEHSHTAVFTPSGGSVTGKLETYSVGASSDIPSTGDFISGGGGSPAFGTGGLGAQLVELSGLTVEGGGVNGTVALGDTGSSGAFEIVNPLQAVNFVICTEGLFPSHP